jgi:hypothetical protein
MSDTGNSSIHQKDKSISICNPSDLHRFRENALPLRKNEPAPTDLSLAPAHSHFTSLNATGATNSTGISEISPDHDRHENNGKSHENTSLTAG